MIGRGRGAHASSRPLARGNPLLGYGIVLLAASIGGVNASVGKVVMLSGGLPPIRLAEFRAAGSALILLAAIALLSRGRFTPPRRDLPFIVIFGIVGLALGQYTYFLSIQRLNVGVALLIVNLAIVLVAVWGRVSGHEHVGPRLWLAIVLALAGLALVGQLREGFVLDGVGVLAALACALTYAVYVVMADRSARAERPAWFLVGWGFVFAALFWALVQPWWGFPFGVLDDRVSLLGRLEPYESPMWALLAYVVPFGTVASFVLYAMALRYIPPTHVLVVAVLEPVFGTIVAWAWLAERLTPLQLLGGALVIVAVALGQTVRASARRDERGAAAPPGAEPHAAAPAPSRSGGGG